MTGNEIRVQGSDEYEVRKVEIQIVTGTNRPYYWSWYRTVFDDPVPPARLQTNITSH
jgi:hypothetical protein